MTLLSRGPGVFHPTTLKMQLAVMLAFVAMFSWGNHGVTDDEFPQASPEELGLRLPIGKVSPGGGRRVIVPPDVTGIDNGVPNHGLENRITGRVYIEVGNRFVVLLPTGKLVAVDKSQTVPSDREFQPVTKEQLLDQYRDSAFRRFQTNATRHYVYVYNCTKGFVDGTSRILETMYPAVFNWCKNYGLNPKDPEFPMVVLIFATEEEFQKYRPVPDGVVAYYNTVTNHVVMYEQRKLAMAAPEIAFKQSVSTIAHEGAHQILHNIDVQDRLAQWPVWFSEGLAEYFAPTELKGRRPRWKGLGLPNDLRLYELANFYRQIGDKRLTRGQLLRQTVESRTLNSLGYAMAWSTVDYLVKRRRKAFADYLQDVSNLSPLQTSPPGTLFTKHFGTDFVAAERNVGDHVASLPYKDPVENQVHFLAKKWKGNRKESGYRPPWSKWPFRAGPQRCRIPRRGLSKSHYRQPKRPTVAK